MNTQLLTLATVQDGVFSYDQALALGVTGDHLTDMIRSKMIIRLRKRAYVLTETYVAAAPDEQYRLRVLAVLRSRPRREARPQDRASHHSALALHRISFFGAPRELVLIESSSGPQRTKDGLAVLRRSTTVTYSANETNTVGPAAACLQVAARFGFEAGVCAMDSALHRRSCTREQLKEEIQLVPERRRTQAQRALDFADKRTESVGESRTRIILDSAGFTVVPQFEIRHHRSVLGRVDFLVDGCVVVEFDGLVKYENVEGKYAIGAEKQREKRIRQLGYEFVRVIWSELDDPVSLVRQVAAAKQDAQRRGILTGI